MLFLSLLLILLVVFGLLAVFLRYVLMRNIDTASGHLQEALADAEQKLEAARKKQLEAEQHHKEVVIQAKNEGEKMKEQLIAEGKLLKEEIVSEARQQSEEMVERARNAAEGLRSEIEARIESAATEKAHRLVELFLSGRMAEETHAYWVKSLLESGFSGLERFSVSEEAKTACVAAAFPLKPAERALLLEQLEKKIGRRLELKEEVKPELILGISLNIGGLVIDGSLQFKILESLRKSKNEYLA